MTRLFFWLRCLGALALVLWLLRSGKLDLSLFAGLRLSWTLAALVVCEAAQMLLPLARWFLLVRARRLDMDAATALHVGLIGSFVTIFIPASLGLDGAKLYYGSRRNKGREYDVLSTVLVDRALGVATLMAIAALFGAPLLLGRTSPFLSQMAWTVGLLLAGAMAVSIFVITRKPPEFLNGFRLGRPLYSVLAALNAFRDQKGIILLAVILSCAGHLFNLLGAWLAFRCLQMPAPLSVVFMVMPLVFLSGIIPLTPLGIGVTDSVAVALCALVGIRGAAETTTLIRGVLVAISALCAPAYLVPVERASRSDLHMTQTNTV